MNLIRRNLALTVVAAVLAVPTYLQYRRDIDKVVDVGRIPLLFDGFTSDNVAQIILAKPKDEQPPLDPNKSDPNKPEPKRVAYDQLWLQHTDKGWVFGTPPGQVPGDLATAPVMKERVENDVFQHLRSIRSDREVLVRQNATPEQLEQYGLDELHAFVIRTTDASGQVLAEVMVGKEASTGQTGTEAVRGVYVRKSDSTDVVLYEYEKGWRRDVTAQQWLDRTVARIDTQKITRLSLRNTATAGTTFVFQRGQGKSTWAPVDPPAGLGALRQSEIESLVQRLSWVQVQDYVKPMQRAAPELKSLGLVPAQIELEVTVHEADNDKVIKVFVGNKLADKNEYYVGCSESAFLMTWAASMVPTFEVDVAKQWFDPVSPDKPKETEPPKDADKAPPPDKKQ